MFVRTRRTCFLPSMIISWRSESVPIYLRSMKHSSLRSCNSTFARYFVSSYNTEGSSNSVILLERKGTTTKLADGDYVTGCFRNFTQRSREVGAPRSLIILILFSPLSMPSRCSSDFSMANKTAGESCAKEARFPPPR